MCSTVNMCAMIKYLIKMTYGIYQRNLYAVSVNIIGRMQILHYERDRVAFLWANLLKVFMVCCCMPYLVNKTPPPHQKKKPSVMQ